MATSRGRKETARTDSEAKKMTDNTICPLCGTEMEFTATGCHTGYDKCPKCRYKIRYED